MHGRCTLPVSLILLQPGPADWRSRVKPFRYGIVVEWSDEDRVFVARVPALPGCAADGTTAEQAAREARRG